MATNNKSERLERLLEEARNLQKQASGTKSGRESSIENLSGIRKELNVFQRTCSNFFETLRGFYSYVIRPIWLLIRRPIAFIFGKYRSFWQRFAYSTDGKSGEKILSSTRAGIILSLTFLFLAMFSPTRLGDTIRFFTTEPIADGILISTSLHTETFYLNTSEEIDPEHNIHSVRGCRTEGVCAETDAVYFRVRPRLAHDIWKLVKYNNPFYVPDHVVAPIAPGVNSCTVTYYGYRMTSSWIARLLRSMQFYPTLLETSCTHRAVFSHIVGKAELSSPLTGNYIFRYRSGPAR